MTPYNGKVAWWAYEMKLEHMANQYKWGRLRSLTSLLKLSRTRLLVWAKGPITDCPQSTQGNSAKARGRAGGVCHLLSPASN